MDRIVITGATSMIGISIIDECIANGVEVLALVREGSPNNARIPDSPLVKTVSCSLDELGQFDCEKYGSFDVFYHIGWTGTNKTERYLSEKQSENIRFTLDAVGLAHKMGCKKFVGAGSQAEYGSHREAVTNEDTPVYPDMAYGVSKYAAGKLAAISAESLGMGCVWIRIFSVYGKYEMAGTMITASIPKMLRGERCPFTKAEQNWDYLYSSDAGRAFFLAGEKDTAKGVYCLGSGQARPLREFITEMRDVLNPSAELAFGEIPYRNGVPEGICADISAIKRDTGWEPLVPFSRGIKLAAEFYENTK